MEKQEIFNKLFPVGCVIDEHQFSCLYDVMQNSIFVYIGQTFSTLQPERGMFDVFERIQ